MTQKISYFLMIFSLVLLNASCTSPGQKTGQGAALGAVVGAAAGAIAGDTKGALIGAAVGGLIGGTIGNRLDKQAKELAKIAETRRTENGIVTKLSGDILFDSGKAGLRNQATVSIDQISEIIRKYPEDRLRILGHTDSTGSDSLNATLSTKRAESVKQRLVQGGIPEEYIMTFGMGEAQPIASNSTADGRQLNRRVEIEITVDESAVPKR